MLTENTYELQSQEAQIQRLVAQVLHIESIEWAPPNSDPKQNSFLARFKGTLIDEDSARAYDQLAQALRPLRITPLFRLQSGRHVVLLASGIIEPRPSNVWVNLILFILTMLSVMFTGMLYSYDGNPNTLEISALRAAFGPALAFTASILGILLAHEFGHYLASRYHRSAATLPYFIPMPFSMFGTMGAVILAKEPHKNKRILLDIGLAGPVAGMVVAIPVLIIGLMLSNLDTIPYHFQGGEGTIIEGNSILYLLLKFAVFKQMLPAPVSFEGLSPGLFWLRYVFTGLPLPAGGTDVMLHPVAWAGWIGMLVTALNLIPAGQLDGGHLVNGLMGKRATVLLPFILIGLGLLGFVWNGWWLWVVLIFFLGRAQAEPLDMITPLDPPRKLMAVLGLILFILVFIPVPFRTLAGG